MFLGNGVAKMWNEGDNMAENNNMKKFEDALSIIFVTPELTFNRTFRGLFYGVVRAHFNYRFK